MKRGQAFQREFTKVKPVVIERARGMCEAHQLMFGRFLPHDVELPCGPAPHRGTHVHHRRYRSRGGTNDLDNLILVCEPMHTWIHQNGKTGGPANLLGLALGAYQSESL